jgi:hypothetical protein
LTNRVFLFRYSAKKGNCHPFGYIMTHDLVHLCSFLELGIDKYKTKVYNGTQKLQIQLKSYRR